MCDSSDEETKKRSSAPPSRQNSQASIDSSCSSFEKIEQDEADGNLFAHTLPPITLLGNAIVDTPDPDPRDVPIKPDQEQYYTAATMRAALGNLVVYSVLMFTLPFVTMYLSYHYIFVDYFGLDFSEAILDAGMVGVGTVFFIMAAFCYVAYLEEVEAEREKLARQAAEERELDERAAAASGGEEEEEEERASVAGNTAPVATDDESKKDK
ncbi:hypothetical protein PRIPAC_93162 [Pristionchus pacificus]|nr:hypothetical protein PRIPAC_93162 [Pristionchus pacificus]